MNIVILGWGSLLWDNHKEFDKHNDHWRLDGPVLMLEFSRISASRDRALTLVLDTKNGAPCKVAYTFSDRTYPDDVISDLRCREGTTLKNIGFYFVDGSRKQGRNEKVLESIRNWVLGKEIDVVIWTDLESNFQKNSEAKIPFSIDAALSHIKGLNVEGKARAAEYVWRAPEFIDTPIRRMFESKPWF